MMVEKIHQPKVSIDGAEVNKIRMSLRIINLKTAVKLHKRDQLINQLIERNMKYYPSLLRNLS